MKKLISLFMVVAMIASIAAVNVSAAGQILMQDSFDDSELNPANWITDAAANAFYIEDGVVKGDRNAVVLQSYYYDPEEDTDPKGTMKAWNYVSFAVDFMLYDFDSDADQHGVGLWWKDYQLKEGETESAGDTSQGGVVYTLSYVVETRSLTLSADLRTMRVEEEETEDGEETTETTTTVETEDGAEGDEEYIVASATIPDDIEVEMDFFDPEPHRLGMMITPNAIHGFFDDVHVLTYKTPNTIGTLMASPLLLINDDMIVGFDNFIATTNDYGLFTLDENVVNGGGQNNVNPTPTPTPSESLPPETQIVTEKVIVTDVETNEEGETVIVTREEIVSNVVTVPVADTNTGGTVGGTGAATGDMIFVVLAVMIVAVGSAVVVKKVRVK